jgi:hypothetical protein
MVPYKEELTQRTQRSQRRQDNGSSGSPRILHVRRQPRNRAAADVVAAGDLPQRFLAMVAALDRLALLVRCQLRLWAELDATSHSPRLALACPRTDESPLELDKLARRPRPLLSLLGNDTSIARDVLPGAHPCRTPHSQAPLRRPARRRPSARRRRPPANAAATRTSAWHRAAARAPAAAARAERRRSATNCAAACTAGAAPARGPRTCTRPRRRRGQWRSDRTARRAWRRDAAAGGSPCTRRQPRGGRRHPGGRDQPGGAAGG